MIGDYLREIVLSKIDAEELAIVYGHPERRLGRMPEVLAMLSRAIDKKPLVWRTTLSELAAGGDGGPIGGGWSSRTTITASISSSTSGIPNMISRSRSTAVGSVARLPVTGSRMSLRLSDLVYERTEEYRTERGSRRRSTAAP